MTRRLKFRTRPLKTSAVPGQQGAIRESAMIMDMRHPQPLSTHDEGLRLVFTPLVFLQQLNAVVAVELDGSPVTMVVDQQGALLQAALTVGLGRNAELCDVSGQVFLDCRTLRL